MAATIERILITTCILAIVPCSGNSAAAADVDYLREIKPLLAAHCTRCHGPLKQEGKLRLDTVPFMKRGGKQGAAIVPRRSTESLLIEMISGKGGLQMPPKGSGEKLEANEIARLREWIDQGAKAPLEAAAELVKYWAFQVPSRPTVPTNGSPEWSRNPIDAFVSMSHQRHKLIPRPLASKPVLLRRVYLDLIGLPPSQAELREFLADESPDAYEKVVERLLASPHFGERWARHWLDVWRYSDWYGFMAEVRYSHQHIWRWRDWVVQSLNDDRGYDQMIVNMLAADEQTPFQVKDLPATGFLVRNRNTDSREAWISDTVEHTAKEFLGLTVACARCHDHMSDPIPQTDYYRFRAVFEPHDVAIDTIPGGGGIARVYDARSSTPTYLFVRGNDRQPDKSQVILPGVPASLGGRWVDPQPTELAVLSRIPALRDDVHAATLRIQSEDLARARSELEHARQALVKIEAITKAEGIPAKANPKDPRRGKVVFEDRFTKLDTERWMIGPGEWKAQDGKLTQRTAGGSDAKWIRTNAKHPRDFAAELRFRVIGGVRYRSVGIRFDASETHSQGVFATANQAAPALAFFSEVSGTRQSLESLRRPYALELNNEITMRVEVRDQLVNAYLNGRLIQAYRLGTDRRDGVLELFTTDAHAEFL
ncbi:MAG: DUF1549 domain-containing protein, partial [Planctomycetes bacterium]|nr:DUF1549 domain-containing protein [Planctomycetota bacterium]